MELVFKTRFLGLLNLFSIHAATAKIDRTSNLTQHWIGYEGDHPFVYLLTFNVLRDEKSEYAKHRETDGLAITLDIQDLRKTHQHGWIL